MLKKASRNTMLIMMAILLGFVVISAIIYKTNQRKHVDNDILVQNNVIAVVSTHASVIGKSCKHTTLKKVENITLLFL
jgi:hypothetical protein